MFLLPNHPYFRDDDSFLLEKEKNYAQYLETEVKEKVSLIFFNNYLMEN